MATFEPQNQDEAEKFQKIADLDIRPTLTVDPSILANFSLQGAWTMLDGRTWKKVIGCDVDTYRTLTLEFLTTMHCRSDHVGKVRFRMLGTWYEKSCEFFSEAFGVGKGGSIAIDDQSMEHFWQVISDGSKRYQSGRVTTKLIANLELRLIHYLLARTVFSRAESPEKINNQDLVALWSIFNRKRANIGYLWKEIVWHRVNHTMKEITVGPYVMLIAQKLKLHTRIQ